MRNPAQPGPAHRSPTMALRRLEWRVCSGGQRLRLNGLRSGSFLASSHDNNVANQGLPVRNHCSRADLHAEYPCPRLFLTLLYPSFFPDDCSAPRISCRY